MSTTTEPSPGAAAALAQAAALTGAGRALDALDVLVAARTDTEDAAIDQRLAELRYLAFDGLPRGGFERWPVDVDGVDRSGPPRIPEIDPGELTSDVLRRQILARGSLLVRGLFADHCERFVRSIDRTFAVQAEVAASAEGSSTAWHRALPLPREQAQSLGRHWVAAAGGMLTCDAPRVLQDLFETYASLGLRDLVTGYLGERPVLSANKCTLRRVPLTTNADWHQDGAFLGAGIRALNIWIALTDCGADSPGMDLVPKRFDEVCPTGTGGAYFDWAVGPETVAELAVDAPVVRPLFKAGDALLFDELFLHRTAIEPDMTRPRYAIESWFFAPCGYPDGQVPLVW